MSITLLPPDNHVMRSFSYKQTIRDDDDRVIGVYGHALKRGQDEDFLSVTWVEFFAGDWQGQLVEAAFAIMKTRRVNSSGIFAWAQVDCIDKICVSCRNNVRFTHEPDMPNNPGHAGIRMLSRDDLLLDRLALEAFSNFRSKDQLVK